MTPPAMAQLVRQVVWEPLSRDTQPATLPVAGGAGGADDHEALFDRLARFVASVRRLIESSEPFPWGTLGGLVDDTASALAKSDSLFWFAHRAAGATDVEHLALHHARVAVLTLRLGATLGYEKRRLHELGMAAALFDIGLWQLPEAVARQSDPLACQEQELYRSHPQLSAAVVRRWEVPSEVIVDAILQHHEREQGQGYPRRLRGPAIHPDAKLIGLVDAYAGITGPRPPRTGKSPHEAVRELIRTRQRAFDPVLVKALVAEISLFPPGTLVRLSNGQIGRVIAPNRQHPLRPRVEMLVDGKSGTDVVDLAERPLLYITGPIAQ
jgi:HD-GYP domain-containing protein (c-di-GMP phosphodiesterase class II)